MKSSNIQQYLMGVIIVCAFLLPHAITFYIMVNPSLCILLVVFSRGGCLQRDGRILGRKVATLAFLKI